MATYASCTSGYIYKGSESYTTLEGNTAYFLYETSGGVYTAQEIVNAANQGATTLLSYLSTNKFGSTLTVSSGQIANGQIYSSSITTGTNFIFCVLDDDTAPTMVYISTTTTPTSSRGTVYIRFGAQTTQSQVIYTAGEEFTDAGWYQVTEAPTGKINFNGVDITNLTFNGNTVSHLYFNGNQVF